MYLINQILILKSIFIFILLFKNITLFSQQVFVYGYIKDVTNQAVPFVNILKNDSIYLATSDIDGYFSLKTSFLNEKQLIISHTSYPSEEVLLPEGDSVRIDVVLSRSTNLKETVIIDNRAEQLKVGRTSNISLISSGYIQENLRGNLYSSLENLPGVQAAHVGGSMSRPLIRGMGGYRIVLAKNYMKQEEHFWNMHQGVATEQYAVEDLELIKGPSSLYYGSDAIGGVLNAITFSVPSVEGVSGDVFLTAKSNNEWLGGTAKINARHKNVFAKAVFSYSSYADYKVPVDSFEYKPMHYAPLHRTLMNTAGEEVAISIQGGITHKRGNSNVILSQYRHKAGFFAFGAGQELMNADTVLHSMSNRDILLPNTETINSDIQYVANFYEGRSMFKGIVAYQQYQSHEYDYIEDITGYRAADLEKYSFNQLDLAYKLSTWSGQISHTYNDTGRYAITTALNTQYQENTIGGFNHLLPHYTRFTSGFFTDHRYKISKNWVWQAGIRFDYGSFNISESINPNPAIADSLFNTSLRKTYPSLTYATGLMFTDRNILLAKIHFGKSFRMPSAYELASYGIHRHNLRFEKGNATLKPEEAYQIDFVLEITREKNTIVISPFLNYFSNYIYLTPTPDFALGTFTGQVYEYRQNKAIHSGAEVSVLMKLPYQTNLLLTGEYVYAVNLDTRLALPYSPPLSMLSELFYRPEGGHFRVGFEAVYVASQSLVAVNECTTPSYIIFNLKTRRAFRLQKQELVLHFSVHNLLNKSYLNHLSYYRRLQIPEPGRNFQLSIQLPFNKQNN